MATKKKEKDNQYAYWEKLQKKWQRETMRDPVIGGDKFNSALIEMKWALQRLIPKNRRRKLVEISEYTGIGNNVEFLRLVYAMSVHLRKMDQLMYVSPVRK